MAKLVFGMNQSLDGYVDHAEMRSGPALKRMLATPHKPHSELTGKSAKSPKRTEKKER